MIWFLSLKSNLRIVISCYNYLLLTLLVLPLAYDTLLHKFKLYEFNYFISSSAYFNAMYCKVFDILRFFYIFVLVYFNFYVYRLIF